MGIGTVSMKLMLFFLVEEGEQSIDKDTRLNKELDLTQACLMINPKVSKNILRHKKSSAMYACDTLDTLRPILSCAFNLESSRY